LDSIPGKLIIGFYPRKRAKQEEKKLKGFNNVHLEHENPGPDSAPGFAILCHIARQRDTTPLNPDV